MVRLKYRKVYFEFYCFSEASSEGCFQYNWTIEGNFPFKHLLCCRAAAAAEQSFILESSPFFLKATLNQSNVIE